jgi:hypothetical protein
VPTPETFPLACASFPPLNSSGLIIVLEALMTEGNSKEGHRASRFLPEETRDHLKAARAEVRHSMEGLFPPEFIDHGRRARKEFLLAARSLIDHALQRLDEPDEA